MSELSFTDGLSKWKAASWKRAAAKRWRVEERNRFVVRVVASRSLRREAVELCRLRSLADPTSQYALYDQRTGKRTIYVWGHKV